jgi:hypothetical protein
MEPGILGAEVASDLDMSAKFPGYALESLSLLIHLDNDVPNVVLELCGPGQTRKKRPATGFAAQLAFRVGVSFAP